MSVLVRWLEVVPSWVVLLAVFTLPALEASTLLGLVVPGEIVVLLGGVVAHQGRVPLGAVMAAAVLGAIAGDNVGYVLGARFGPRLLSRARQRATRHLDRTRGLVRRYGGPAVLLGRWAASLRAVVPSVAGASGVPYRRFIAYNIAGGTLWGISVAGIGFLAGAAYARVEHSVGLAGTIGALVLLTALITLSSKAHERGATETLAPRRSQR